MPTVTRAPTPMTRLAVVLAALTVAAPAAPAQEQAEPLAPPPEAEETEAAEPELPEVQAAEAGEEAEAPAAEAEASEPPVTPGADDSETAGTEPVAEEEPWIPQRFGLDALLGVQIGMPLDQAVNILRLRGFRAQAAEATRLIEGAREDEAAFPRSATGSPPLGLVVTRSLVPTPWGTREIETHTTVVLERRVAGVSVRVRLSAERSPEDSTDGSDYGAGRVFGVETYQDYTEVDGPVGWFQIEAQLRRAAFAVPTCESLGERVRLVWMVTEGTADRPLAAPEACADAIYDAAEAAAPDAVIAALVAGEPLAVPAVNSLTVQIDPAPSEGWVWMQRLDTGLQAEAIATAVRGALESPPSALSRVEF